MRKRQPDQQSRVFNDLSSLLRDMILSPIQLLAEPIHPLSPSQAPPLARWREMVTPITPAGFASLMLGIAVALMFCGSITFFIGFMLMPWVLGLFMLLYIVGMISILSLICRSILWYATSATVKPSSLPAPRKHVSGQFDSN